MSRYTPEQVEIARLKRENERLEETIDRLMIKLEAVEGALEMYEERGPWAREKSDAH